MLVSASACLLTVSIVGSTVFLLYKGYRRYELKGKVRNFIESLENRTAAELDERALELKERPGVAKYVLPELRKALAYPRSDDQIGAAIRISTAFLDHRGIEESLFRLRLDPREMVAGPAVAALSQMEPPERAIAVLGRCLDGVDEGVVSDAVIDEVCAGLCRLGDAGRVEMQRHLSKLSADRRLWLVGYVCEGGGPTMGPWLSMLARDGDLMVKSAAEGAIQDANAQGPAASGNPRATSAP